MEPMAYPLVMSIHSYRKWPCIVIFPIENGDFPYIAMENGSFGDFIVSFPIDSMVIFHSHVNVYQRVTISSSSDTIPVGET